MNKTDIDWCDSTWNPITGCLHNCEYCYAEGIVKRFGNPFSSENNYQLDFCKGHEGVFLAKYHTKPSNPYPNGFNPTLHLYRLHEYVKATKARTIFVGSMADVFGEWIPDEWIMEVFNACNAAPQHRYIFLTKNPKRYWELHDKGLLPEGDGYWFGATMTHGKQQYQVANSLPRYCGRPKPTHRNTFVSVEPLMDDIEFNRESMGGFFTYFPQCIKWAILGAETGNRRAKVVPKREWMQRIVEKCKTAGIPIFMKNNLANIWRDPLIQQYPWEAEV